NEDLARVIRDGVPNAGMPAFGRALSDDQVQALANLILSSAPGQGSGDSGSGETDLTLDAKTLNNDLSHGVQIVVSEADPQLRYVGYFDMGDYICYDDIDLSGVRSIEIEYAKAGDIPGRFAILAYNRAD